MNGKGWTIVRPGLLRRSDGIEIERLPNTWPGQSAVYSVRERGEWWVASDGRRRSWGATSTAARAVAEERPLYPKTKRVEVREYLAANRDATFGDVMDLFGVTVMDAIDLVHGRGD